MTINEAIMGEPATDTVATLERRIRELEGERDKLQAFKDWVHTYLDGKNVPHHPPGTHGAEGCRIGDRMDWVFERIRKFEVVMQGMIDVGLAQEARVKELEAELARVAPFLAAHGFAGYRLEKTP